MTLDNNLVVLDHSLLESCLNDLGNYIKKKSHMKGPLCEIIIVGGASVILNYGFRMSTVDIDCIDRSSILMNDAIHYVADKYDLPFSWINTDFIKSSSYSPKLVQYSSYYKSYGNGVLQVRTVKDEYLLAMKIVAGRKHKNDYSDILGIIDYFSKQGKKLTIDIIEKAIINLYGSLDVVEPKALMFAKDVITHPELYTYDKIRTSEMKNADELKERIQKDKDTVDIKEVLRKLDI